MTFKEKYITEIRNYMRDFEERNEILLDQKESSDAQIESAIDAVYRHAVNAPPVKLEGTTLEDLANMLWFKYGVVAQLLESIVIENIRNTLPYQDGGIQIDENYKAGPYSQMAQTMQQKFDLGLSAYKLKYNIESFSWGGTSDSSPFGYFGLYGPGRKPIR